MTFSLDHQGFERTIVLSMQLSSDFWNFRGSFKIAKIVDIGTHMSLVRRANGRFIMIDSCALDDTQRGELLQLTDGGRAIEAIINVHPFHTLHCRSGHELAPHARLIGTRRHRQQDSDLPWDSQVIEDAETQAAFSEDLAFTRPDGVDLVTDDDDVHAGSVLVRHERSAIVHVDDTLNVIAAPGFLGRLLPQSRLKFHPMLPKALQPRSDAADAFSGWARALAENWSETRIVCAAHSAIRHLPEGGWRKEIHAALADIESKLEKHRAANG